MMQMNLVVLSHGSYSDYGIDTYLLGAVDPQPILDKYALSFGIACWEEARIQQFFKAKKGALPKWDWRNPPKEVSELWDLEKRLYNGVKDLLVGAGFTEVQALEINE